MSLPDDDLKGKRQNIYVHHFNLKHTIKKTLKTCSQTIKKLLMLAGKNKEILHFVFTGYG